MAQFLCQYGHCHCNTVPDRYLLPFYCKGPRPVLRDGSRAARETTAVTGTPNHLNDGVICTVHTEYANVAVGRGLETHG